jgi:RNA polymerase sigma-70 factor (ECF subfamily)
VFSFSNKTYHAFADEALILYVAQGKEKAFTVLYERYSKRMLYFFYQRLYQDEQRAQDFLQDLFLKVLEKSGSFDPNKKFKTWIYTLAANMCKNEYRRDAVRGLKVNDFAFDDIQELSSVIFTGKFDADLFIANLKTELDKLDDSQRITFLLRYQEELSVNEISEILGCAEGTVKSRLFYCSKKLAIKLKEFNPQND